MHRVGQRLALQRARREPQLAEPRAEPVARVGLGHAERQHALGPERGRGLVVGHELRRAAELAVLRLARGIEHRDRAAALAADLPLRRGQPTRLARARRAPARDRARAPRPRLRAAPATRCRRTGRRASACRDASSPRRRTRGRRTSPSARIRASSLASASASGPSARVGVARRSAVTGSSNRRPPLSADALERHELAADSLVATTTCGTRAARTRRRAGPGASSTNGVGQHGALHQRAGGKRTSRTASRQRSGVSALRNLGPAAL